MRTENIRRDKVVDFRAPIVKLTLFVEKNRKQKYNNLAAVLSILFETAALSSKRTAAIHYYCCMILSMPIEKKPKKEYDYPVLVRLEVFINLRKVFMKLNVNFIHHQLDGQAVIVPTAGANFHGLVQGNKTLAAIAACLQQDTTEEEIVNTLCARFDGDREVIKADVAEAVKKLREIGAIDE